MPANKTQPTDARVESHIETKANDAQRSDCRELMALLETATGAPPTMWGPGIVGFGAYRYTYASGRTGEAPLAAFAIRGRELVLYLDCDASAQEALLTRLGPHKAGKSCVYFKRLADLDRSVLEQLVQNSIDEIRRRHGGPSDA